MIRQHETLRVPNGWEGQSRAFVIQMERILTDLYRLFSILDETAVKGIAYDSDTHKLTVTINGEAADVIGLASQSADGFMSDDDKTKLDGIEEHANNYSLPMADNGTRGGIQIGYSESGKKYALKLDSEKAYTEVPWTDTKNTAGGVHNNNKKMYLIAAINQSTNPQTYTNDSCYIGEDNALYSNGSKVLTAHQDISGKADKVTGGTENNFAALDVNGNLKDSGHKHSDYITSHQDISGKADKVAGGTNGNFAGLDSSGNMADSGHKHGDYVTDVAYDAVNKKITRTKNGTAGDVVSVSTIKSALGAFTHDQLAGR